jgi:DNA-binding NarL/FixJ family response regulator
MIGACVLGVADDQPLYRMGVVKLLEAAEDRTLVAEATNGMEAILAIEILALSDAALAERLILHRAEQTRMVMDDPSNEGSIG